MAGKKQLTFFRGDGTRGVDFFTFDEVARIERIGSHEYKANIHPEYSYAPSAHGGYLVSLMWRAIRTHFETTLSKYGQPDTIHFHNEFLRPATVGPCTIIIKDVRLGKASSVVHATLIQKGSEKCVAYATQAGLKASQNTISLDMSYQLSPLPPPIDFEAVLKGQDHNWIRFDVGRDPTVPNHTLCNLIFAHQRPHTHLPSPTDPAFLRTTTQWICPRVPEENWHTETLGLVLDSMVPPLENWYSEEDGAVHNYVLMPRHSEENEKAGRSSYDNQSWSSSRFYPTVNMSIEVKRQLPPEGEKWLMIRQHTKEVVESRMDIDATVWDPKGRLICVSKSMWYLVDTAAGPPLKPGEKPSGRFSAAKKGTKL